MSPDNHQIARQQLQAWADGLLDPEDQLPLERHLAACPDCRAYADQLAGLENRLRSSLQKRWPAGQSPQPDLPGLLAHSNIHSRRDPLQASKPSPLPSLGWIGLVAMIVIIISFSVRSLVPEPAAPVEPSRAPTTLSAPLAPTGQPSPTGETPATEPGCETVEYTVQEGDTLNLIASLYGVPAQAILDYNEVKAQFIYVGQLLKIPSCERAPDSSITSTPNPPTSDRTSLFPLVEFSLPDPLPTSPDQLNLYRLVLGEALRPENALSQAQTLGLNGRVFAQPSEGMSDSLYAVTDGYGLARFLNFPDQFLYWPGTTGLSDQHGELPPFEQQAAAAEQFLQARGLLDEPYRVEPLEAERGGVNFVRLLDGLPVINGIGVNRSLLGYNHAILNPQGQVLEVTHSQPGYEPLGQFPVLSAAQAWERLSQENALQRLRYAVLDPQIPDTYQTWLRPLPRNQPLDLYGYPDVLAPAAGDPTPLVLFRDLPTSGYTTGMQPGDFLHVWGQIIEPEAGHPVLQIEGWDLSELEDTMIEGLLTRSGAAQGQLVSEAGSSYTLNDLPADLPDGARLMARGVLVDGALDWSSLSSGELSMPYGNYFSCGGGGGGGGSGEPLVSNFGEGLLAIPNLSGQPVTPSPTVEVPGMPAVGTRLQDLQGIASVMIHLYADTSQMDVNLIVDAGVLGEYPVYLRLEGPALTGIETYTNLPVRVWGQVVRHSDYQAVVQVERYEPTYPDLRVQAWLGTQQVVTLEGQQVVLFTAQDGQQFVLRGSILYGPDNMVGRPGDQVIYEGIAIPGESFGSYPLLRELAGSMANGITDIGQYQLTQNEPGVIDETQSTGSQRLELSGKATIEQVELAYAAISTNRCTTTDAANPDMAAQLIVQPIWRFIGSFEDGRRIEIQVSALPETLFGR